jgi:hypothetical protein
MQNKIKNPISGSLTLTGSLTATGDLSAVTASVGRLNATVLSGAGSLITGVISASYASTATTASHATTALASGLTGNTLASNVLASSLTSLGTIASLVATSASVGRLHGTVISGSGALIVGVVSSSYAVTASYALNGGGSAAVTASNTVLGGVKLDAAVTNPVVYTTGSSDTAYIRKDTGGTVAGNLTVTLTNSASIFDSVKYRLAGSDFITTSGTSAILNAGSFSLIGLGGLTSSFPALKRSGTVVQFRLADDSADANISANTGSFSLVSGATYNNIVMVSGSRMAVGLSSVKTPIVDIVTGDGDGSPNEVAAFRIRATATDANTMTMQLGVHIGGGGGANQGYGYLQSIYWGGSNNSLILNPKGGNVGIGTSAPTRILVVSGSMTVQTFNSTEPLGAISLGGLAFGNANPAYPSGLFGKITTVLDGAAGWYEGGGLAFCTISGSDVSSFEATEERMRISSHGNVVIGSGSALATTARYGFLYIPTTAGTPSGTPLVSYTGRSPIVIDSDTNSLYLYNSGWKKAGVSPTYALTDGATVAIDWNNGPVQKVVLGGNRTITFANPVSGGRYLLIIVQDATGSRTIASWPTIKWTGGLAPTLTTTANKADMISITYDGTSYYGMASVNF